MPTSETITQFLLRQHQPVTGALVPATTAPSSGCRVYDIEKFCQRELPLRPRDFYKISLLLGPGVLHYPGRSVALTQPALVVSTPLAPYAWEGDVTQQRGYFCLFTAEFLHLHDHPGGLLHSPLFQPDRSPVCLLDEPAVATVQHLFQQLLAEQAVAYPYQQDLLRTYLNLLLHEALKLQPALANHPAPAVSAPYRLTVLFRALLAQQFPLVGPTRPVALRTARDFAAALGVHVNYLNRAVRAQTGQTTTQHIQASLLREAQQQLQRSDWPIADLAYALGFESPTYFTNFLKKHTGLSARALRLALGQNSLV